MPEQQRSNLDPILPGLVLIATIGVGVVSLAIAFGLAGSNKEFQGMALIAAALSFGLLSNAIFRR